MSCPTVVQTCIVKLCRAQVGRTLFIGAAVTFCGIGLAYSWWALGSALRYPDEHDYLSLAANLLQHGLYSLDGSSPDASRPPGYAILLTLPLALIDSVHAVRLLHYMLLVAIAWQLSAFVQHPCWSRWQCATALLIGPLAYPVLFYTAGTVFPQTAIGAALSTVLVLLQHPRIDHRRAALIGVLCGGIVLMSPTALMIVPLAILIIAVRCPGGWRQTSIVLLVCCSVLACWSIRNALVLEQPVLLSTNLSNNLDNAVRHDTDNRHTPSGDTVATHAVDRLLQLLSEPAIYAQKLGNFFDYRNDLVMDAEQSRWRNRIMFVTFHTLLALVLLRIGLARHHRLSSMEIAILTLYVGTALFHALVFARIRYRLPFDMLLVLPALNALCLVLQSRKRRAHAYLPAGLSARQSSGHTGDRPFGEPP